MSETFKHIADVNFHRYTNGLPYFAHVVLEVEYASDSPSIVFSCSGRGFRSQGYVEEVPATGYDDWKNGARAGISYALAFAERDDCRVNVT